MASDAPVLAFDTSAAHCAAALLRGGRILTRAEPMARGQAERLMPLLQELLAEGGVGFADLTRIGVGTGPGNFTGIRISVSAARGLALALGVPAIGVSCLEALREATRRDSVAIPAPREMAYLSSGTRAACLVPAADVPPDTAWPGVPGELVATIARIAAAAPQGCPPPAPLYLRPADAAPSRVAAPRLLDES